MEPLEISLSIDVQAIKDAIENSGELNDNHEVFKQLSVVKLARDELEAALEIIKGLESETKATINSKAKVLYGQEWAAIKGDGYKITRSGTGPVFEITGDVPEDFLAVKVSVDTKAVNTFIKENSTLPEGISYNKQRGESLRITVHPDEDQDSQTQP